MAGGNEMRLWSILVLSLSPMPSFTSVIVQVMKSSFQLPCWVSYVDQVKMVEGTPVTFQTTEENHFKATVRATAARTDKTKGCLAEFAIQSNRNDLQ